MNTLICTLGSSTAVVTETIDALIARKISIGKVIVIHTSTKELLHKKAGEHDISLSALKKNLSGYYKKKFKTEFVKLPFDDIITLQDNDYLLRKLLEMIDSERKQNAKIYLSIAGGRKTMSAMALFAGYFMGCSGVFHVITKSNEFELAKKYGLHPPVDELILIDIPNIDMSAFWRSIHGQSIGGKAGSGILELLSADKPISLAVSDLSKSLISVMSDMKLAEDYQRLYPMFNDLCQTVSVILEKRLHDLRIKRPDIQQRVKTLANIRKNIIRYGESEGKEFKDPLHELKDIAASRIVCYTAEDVKKVLRHIDKGLIPELEFSGKEIHNKDFFGYRAVHYQVRPRREYFPKADFSSFTGFECELQIKTIFSHSWASIEHSSVYKSEGFKNLSAAKKTKIRNKFLRIGKQLKVAEIEFDKVLKELRNDINDKPGN